MKYKVPSESCYKWSCYDYVVIKNSCFLYIPNIKRMYDPIAFSFILLTSSTICLFNKLFQFRNNPYFRGCFILYTSCNPNANIKFSFKNFCQRCTQLRITESTFILQY